MFGEAKVVGRWEVRSGQAEQAATQRTSAGLEHEPGPLNTAGVCHLRRQRASSAVKAKGQRANAGAVGSARRWGRRCCVPPTALLAAGRPHVTRICVSSIPDKQGQVPARERWQGTAPSTTLRSLCPEALAVGQAIVGRHKRDKKDRKGHECGSRMAKSASSPARGSKRMGRPRLLPSIREGEQISPEPLGAHQAVPFSTSPAPQG